MIIFDWVGEPSGTAVSSHVLPFTIHWGVISGSLLLTLVAKLLADVECIIPVNWSRTWNEDRVSIVSDCCFCGAGNKGPRNKTMFTLTLKCNPIWWEVNQNVRLMRKPTVCPSYFQYFPCQKKNTNIYLIGRFLLNYCLAVSTWLLQLYKLIEPEHILWFRMIEHKERKLNVKSNQLLPCNVSVTLMLVQSTTVISYTF